MNEVSGVLLFFGGVLLLLALCSFDARDVPSWAFGLHSPCNRVPVNFVGRVGAIVANLCYFLFGGASYFGAVALIGLGVSKFLHQENFGIRAGWAFVFVLSWSTLLDLQKVILLDWKARFGIEGPGGWFGHRIDLVLGKNVLGGLGSSNSIAKPSSPTKNIPRNPIGGTSNGCAVLKPKTFVYHSTCASRFSTFKPTWSMCIVRTSCHDFGVRNDSL
jgi:hypothetical protein